MSVAAPRGHSRRAALVVAGVVSAGALVGCAPARPVPPPPPSPTVLPDGPGRASCTIQLGDHVVTATLTETTDAYTFTYTGEPITEKIMTPDDGRATFTGALRAADDDPAKAVSFVVMFDYGELIMAGAGADGIIGELDVTTTFADGTFTASYPKPVADLSDAPPTSWGAGIYYDAGDTPTAMDGYKQCNKAELVAYEPLD